MRASLLVLALFPTPLMAQIASVRDAAPARSQARRFPIGDLLRPRKHETVRFIPEWQDRENMDS